MRLLRRILRRPCAGRLIADDGLGEVLIGQLQVVLRRNRLAVSDPLADDVHRELLRQFRFPRAAKILERLWPRLQPSLADDPVHVCPQIRANVAVACDDVLSSRLGFLEDLQKMQAQLGKQRDHPARAAIVMLGLRTWHADAPVLPVHVGPGQREHFGRAPQAAKAGKGEDQPPLRIRAGIYHLLRIFAANEVVAVVVCPHRNANALERIGDDQTSAFRRTEELSGAPNGPPDRILGLPFADQVHTEVLSVAERDVAQGQVSREERQQVCSCSIQIDLGAWLDVGSTVNVRTGKRAEHG